MVPIRWRWVRSLTLTIPNGGIQNMIMIINTPLRRRSFRECLKCCQEIKQSNKTRSSSLYRKWKQLMCGIWMEAVARVDLYLSTRTSKIIDTYNSIFPKYNKSSDDPTLPSPYHTYTHGKSSTELSCFTVTYYSGLTTFFSSIETLVLYSGKYTGKYSTMVYFKMYNIGLQFIQMQNQ